MSDSRYDLTGGLADTDVFAAARVLVIDDRVANIEVLDRMLRAAGMSDLHAVTDARVAVERCLEVDPDIVLLDMVMPHVDGATVLTSLRSALPRDAFLPVVVVTADPNPDVRARALDAGANDFLTKPFDPLEVVQRVRNLLATRALYQTVKDHNARLQEELDAQASEQRRVVAERRERHARIAAVITDRAVRMEYQPIVELASGQTVGVEALARFDRTPRRPPEVWFAEAADAELTVELDLAAIDAALAGLGRLPPGVFLSLNASPLTVTRRAAHEALRRVPPTRVVVELTEHTRVDDYETLRAALDELRLHGVRVAVDDAGAGYAGLRQILRLRPDIIKLDVDLTRGLDHDPVRRALAASLVAFGRDTGAVIIAEGIETPEEHETLRRLGVRWGQGYHYARPGPLPIATTVAGGATVTHRTTNR